MLFTQCVFSDGRLSRSLHGTCWKRCLSIFSCLSPFLVQYIVCHMMLFVISFSFGTGCDVLYWGGISKCTWGRCSVLSVQHLRPVISRIWHSELFVDMKEKGLTMNSLHTQDFPQSGFWVREKLRSECSKCGVRSLPCVLEKYVRISRNYWKGGSIQSRDKTWGYQGWEEVGWSHLLLCQ